MAMFFAIYELSLVCACGLFESPFSIEEIVIKGASVLVLVVALSPNEHSVGLMAIIIFAFELVSGSAFISMTMEAALLKLSFVAKIIGTKNTDSLGYVVTKRATIIRTISKYEGPLSVSLTHHEIANVY